MDQVIYSVTPLRTFSGGIFLIIFFFGLGIAGAFWSIGGKKDSIFSRIATGCSAIVLLVVGVIASITLLRTALSGSISVDAHVNKKRVVVSNCDTSGGQCTSYVLETTTGQKQIDFTLPQSAYDKAEEGLCYEFTYYPPRPLFDLFQNKEVSQLYESTASISRVAQVDASRCQ
ncbi:MAG: hypothetical protein U0Z26_08770 [Anaerolineales bacterium]